MNDGTCRFRVALDVLLRDGTRADLPALEWWGWFSAHREIFHDAFAGFEQGEGLFLVAEAQGFPVGQIWIDLARYRDRSRALLWALRVLPGLQGAGIGRHLVEACEVRLRARGVATIEVTVEKTNPGARRFFERLGYRLVGEHREIFRYRDPAGGAAEMPLDQWRFEKPA